MKSYYERRAPEYDDWWRGTGLHASRRRPGWRAAVRALKQTITGLSPARTLDVACGTGFLTRHLPGEVVALDQSESMLEIARKQAPAVEFVRRDALPLPFPDSSFDRVFTSFFYGHLEDEDGAEFLREARRVGSELVLVDSALHEGHEPVEWQERLLKDGSRWKVYKRFFTPEQLAEELGRSRTLYADYWFVAVTSP
ncbi:MAG: class I SAM-dependent methyltransferase [Actinomycetota bacterium]|nr:class I SAM-dependent methyltransferase [Actinomycetota bacterium]